MPAIGAYGWIKNLVTLAGGGLVVHGGAIVHRYGLGSWQRGREVIWEKVLAALQVPVYLTIHGKGICEPGAGRWLDERTFVFNESVVANEEGLRQLEFVLSNLGVELVVCHSPGWYDSTGHGNIGTSHMDMVMLTVDHGTVLLAPHLVNYGFVRELIRRDYTIIEVPVEEYWDLALNGVTLAPGKVLMNAGSPTVVKALEQHGVEVIQVDFSESTDSRSQGSTAPRSSSSATKPISGRATGTRDGRGGDSPAGSALHLKGSRALVAVARNPATPLRVWRPVFRQGAVAGREELVVP